MARHHVASVTLSTRASGEMADALASGASVRKDVGVQVPPRARMVSSLRGTNTLISQLSEEAIETVLLITKHLPILGVLRPPNLPISSVWHK